MTVELSATEPARAGAGFAPLRSAIPPRHALLLARLWPGVLLSCVVAVASVFIADHRGGPTLLYALLIGMALNPVAMEGRARAGADFSARTVLRAGIALLGARITFVQLAGLGWQGAALMVICVAATLAFGALAARWFGVSRRVGVLTGGATAICGASAAIAIATVLPRDERSDRELVFTIAGVTILSTAAMILYPLIASAFGLAGHRAGVFLGGTIHDVAQVVGAGYSMSPQVGDVAVLTKLVRVALLLPAVVVLSLVFRRGMQRDSASKRDPLVPRFLLVFALLVALRSAGVIPAVIVEMTNQTAQACLVVAIAAVGLKTSPLEMKKVGARAFALLLVEGLFLAALVLGAEAFA
jgi:uncharacterized integral membrane protein (TIGR00698 family)